MMMMRLARCALVGLALTGLVACGGGGGDKETPTPAAEPTPTPDPMPEPTPEPAPGQMPEMRIMPKPDEPGTIDAAVAITGDDPVSGNLSSPTDVDYFRLALDEPSTVTFWTTGEAETVVTLVDGDGNNLSAAGAGATTLTTGTGATFAAVAVPADSAGRVSVTTALDNVYARVTGRPDGRVGNYDLVRTVAANAAPIAKRFSTVTVKAGGAAVTVDMSDFFTDPEGGALKFSASLPPASFGPVSLGLTVSGSVLSIISPEGLTPGPVSITVTATDPFGLVTVQVLSVTVQPPDNAGSAPTNCPVTYEVITIGSTRFAYFVKDCSNFINIRYCCPGYRGRIVESLRCDSDSPGYFQALGSGPRGVPGSGRKSQGIGCNPEEDGGFRYAGCLSPNERYVGAPSGWNGQSGGSVTCPFGGTPVGN